MQKFYQLINVLFPDPLIISIFFYTLTGVISPTLIDYVSHTYETDQYALIPVFATAVGLMLVVPLSKLLPLGYKVELIPLKSTEIKTAGIIASLDLTATSLVTIGLVNVGSATFTVIYSSAAAWTSLLSWWGGNPLSRLQVIGVISVTTGLFINGVGHVVEDESRSESGLMVFLVSCLALLIGTIIHSVVMIKIDDSSRDSRIKALQVASVMGRFEVFVLMIWNVGRLVLVSEFKQNIPTKALPWFGLLSVNQSIHSLAFFNMIGRLGAVGSAVLKGFLALNTFGLAAALFCEKGHSEQCLSPLKTTSMLLVFAGGIIYGISSSKKPKKESELPI